MFSEHASIATRSIELVEPPAALSLHMAAMTYTSGLSVLDQGHLQLVSKTPDIEPEALLGQPVDILVRLRDDGDRHLCGYVTAFGLARHRGRFFGYEATIRPWLWFLTLTSDCRIFQNQTVEEIVSGVFDDHADIANYEFRLTREYPQRAYCVQYRETDFNFVSRLLEDEGIYWYFEHGSGNHTLVLMDSLALHTPIPGYETLPYCDNAGQRPPNREHVSSWNFSRSVESGRTALASYDFERPSTLLHAKRTFVRSHEHADYERFDFQGDFGSRSDGEQSADTRLDELQCRFEQLNGVTNAHGLAAGHLFSLTGHPRDDQNIEYLCLHTTVSAQVASGESGDDADDLRCSFAAIPATQQYRPPRRTPKPFVQGPQTAVVVGPEGEEIHTDQYGRVKVQFHWDRRGRRDEKSSCWVRVSSPWAGKRFGVIQLPRIGQEVIVDFIEGNPDQPIITGRVYNAEQMPPWPLPECATQSGVLTRSTKGGAYGNANEISFEDRKGNEQVVIHAERNMSRSVENDDAVGIGRDRSVGIRRDESLKVDRNRFVHVKENETHIVDLAQKLKVGADQHNHVVGDKATRVDGVHTLIVQGNLRTDTKSDRIENTSGSESRTIGGDEEHAIDGNQVFTIGGDLSYKARRMVFEAEHIEHNVTGANSVVVSSPNGPYTIMANKFAMLSNTDASILAIGKINQTSTENNVTVMGSNQSAYMGTASDTKHGLARSTFFAMAINNHLGPNISNTLGVHFETAACGRIGCAVGVNLELNSLKIFAPGGGGGAAGAALATDGAALVGAVLLSVASSEGISSAAIAYSETNDQYSDARVELREQANAAEAAGHPGLAERLRRLAGGQPLGRAPTSTTDFGGELVSTQRAAIEQPQRSSPIDGTPSPRQANMDAGVPMPESLPVRVPPDSGASGSSVSYRAGDGEVCD
jgi:type VI secretion system secreted protein VgrG